MITPRTTMNGKPVLTVPVKTVLNLESKFLEKMLCDGPALALGDGCAYSCSFCYVPAVYRKLDRIREALDDYNAKHGTALKHEDVVILREGAIEVLRGQLLTAGGARRFPDRNDRRVVYASPADDVAANMDLVKATADACALILELTNWQIRLLSKSNLLPKVAELLVQNDGLIDRIGCGAVRERMIFGFSTGTLEDAVAKAFEEGTPLVSKRIKALHEMQDAGFRTYGMVCPSLPMDAGAYPEFAREAAEALRADRLEHVWAEAINLRGESFDRTIAALTGAGLHEDAERVIAVSRNTDAWEAYNRLTFLAHAEALKQWPGKLRYLTYVTPATRQWWADRRELGAVLLGGHSQPETAQTA